MTLRLFFAICNLSLLVWFFVGCDTVFNGSETNPVDANGSNYQGYPSVLSSDQIEPLSTSEGNVVSTGRSFTVDKVVGAIGYELEIYQLWDYSYSNPIYDNQNETSNTLTFGTTVQLQDKYFFRVRARFSSGWDTTWSPFFELWAQS
jgi:hypothetical protein